MSTGVLYYTDGRLYKEIAQLCLDNLYDVVPVSMKLVEIHQAPETPRSLRQMYINILCGIGQVGTDYVYLAEHDVLYPPEYFTEIDKDIEFGVCKPGYYLDGRGYHKRNGTPLSSFVGHREALEKHFNNLLTQEKPKQSEPREYTVFNKSFPYIDIRHGDNYTGGREGKTYKQTIEYWGAAKQLEEKMK